MLVQTFLCLGWVRMRVVFEITRSPESTLQFAWGGQSVSEGGQDFGLKDATLDRLGCCRDGCVSP